jgi:XTP/dITP diphosphohydrolase
MRKLLLASANKGKIPGLKMGLGDIPFEIVTLNEVKMPDGFEVEEPGSTYEAHAAIKAIIYGKHSNLVTVADDSGIEIDALNGEPGVHTAHYFEGTKEERIAALLEKLKNVPESKRSARYRDVIAVYDPVNDKVRFAEATTEGRIAEASHGENGFGYDQVFFSNDLGKTFGEATIEETNRVSHRGRALAKAREILLAEFV